MKPSEKEILMNVAEKLLEAIHINRTVTMAVDFFNQSCSKEGIEAVQYTLQCQETIIEKLYKEVEELRITDY